MSKPLALIATLALSGCTQTPETLIDPYTMLPGKWGWEDSDDCKSAPENISFSEDRRTMHLAHAPIKEDGAREPRREVTYRVLRTIPNGLSMSLVGENRLDATGKPVTWDLILLDQNQYCWRRNDWRPTGCTKSIKRCGT